MRQRLTSIVLALALVVPALVVMTAAPASATVFSNGSSIALNDPNSQSTGHNNAIATPYPSTIAVSGLSGTVSHVAVTLKNATYLYAQDIDVLLVGPSNQSLIVAANIGPPPPGSPTAHNVDNVTLTLDDNAATTVAQTVPWGAPNSTTVSKPVNYGGFNEFFLSPAPASPWGNPGPDTTNPGLGACCATLASVFNGTNPNGTWSLYVITTSGGDLTGAIAGGWSLDITTANAPATSTALTSGSNPSFTSPPGNSVTLTATVSPTPDGGTVAFKDGGTTISGCAAVSVVAGTATCTTSFTAEGDHSLMASYSGTANFGASSSAPLSQRVDNHTTGTAPNYCNASSITLNDFNTSAQATPYPSNIFVSGLSGVVNHVTVTLNNVTYGHSQDIDALLVGPGGQSLILVANVGPSSGPGAAVNNATVTFSDAGTLPPSGQLTSWSALPNPVKPVNYGGNNETWPAPAPAPPWGNPGPDTTQPGPGPAGATLASKFNGINGNGTWKLYVVTTSGGDMTGAIAGGWCANITAVASAATTTTLVSDNNPSFASPPGDSVTFTAAVKETSDMSKVAEGSVSFTDGGTPITGCNAVMVASGQATCTTSFAAEGDHLIMAQFNGTANFGPSGATTRQIVNSHTTVTNNNFCNTGPITLNNPPNNAADAAPYPSNIFVTGRPGPLQHLTVTLLDATYSHSQDIDVLLVGSGGQTLILVANLGPNSGPGVAANHATLTLDDNGILPPLGQATPWGSNSTFRPVNYGGFNENWGPPAPPGPYGDPGTTGTAATLNTTYNGTVPNGTWSLYVITTAPGDGAGAIAGGWCLGVTSPTPPALTKSFGAPSIPLNGSTSLTFTVQNPNTSASLSGIGFTDTLPAGVAISTPNGLTGTCGGGTIAATAGSDMVSLSGATLAGGASCTFSVNVTGATPGSKMNTTSAISSTEGGSGAPASATLLVVAPPVLSKSFAAPSIPVTGSTSLSFTVTNFNSGSPLSGVGFTDTLPSGLVVSTPNGLSGSCGGGTITAVAGSSSVTLANAILTGGATCTFAVNVKGVSAGAQVNTTSAVSSNEGGSGNPATATETVASGPPQITKSFGAASIPLNGSTTLSFTIANPAANGTSTGIGFTDTLPAGLVVSSPNGLTGSCGGGTIAATAGSSTVSLSGATLAAGAICSFSVKVTGTSQGVVNNSVTVSSANGGTGNTSNAALVVVGPPILAKSFGASAIALNGSTALTFTITNTNQSSSLSGVGFTDSLPAGLVVATPNGLTGSCGGGTISATAGGSSVSLTGATLTANSSCTFSVNVTGTTPGVKTNTTSAVTSTEGGSGAAATATLTVVAPPQITKSFGASGIAVNGSTTLSFTINNFNNTMTLTGVAFTDTLPAGLVVATPNGLTGTCGGGTITSVAGGSSVSLAGATLAPSASCTFSVNVTGSTGGAKNNSVTVTSTNGGTGNTATATVSVASPPTITKSFGAATIPLNGSTTLSFTITNPAGNQTLTGIGFADTLPSGLVVATPNGLTGTCGGGTIGATAGSSTVSVSGATLAAGASCNFSVNVTGTTNGSKLNSVTVSSANAGTGNTSNAKLTVLAPPNLSKAFGASSVPVGGTTTLTFSLSNPNLVGSLSGVGLTDTLPPGLVVATPNALNGSCDGGTITAVVGSNSVSLAGATLGPLPGPTSTCTYAVNVTATTAGTKVNTTSTVSSDQGGTGMAATATLIVVAPPQIAKSFGAANIALNGTTTLTFTITNPAVNTVSATGVGFTDTLPAGLVVATPNGVAGTCGGGTIVATAGSSTVSLAGATIAALGSCSFSVNVTGTTSGIKTNSVTVTSTNGGTGNTATATVSVALPPQIAKSFGAPTIAQNGSTTLGFTISNPPANGSFALTGVGFTDTLPAGLVVATPNGLTGSCGGGTIGATAGSSTVSLAGATLGGGASCAFSVNVTGTTAGVKNNSVTVTSGNAGPGNTANASVTVLAPPTIAKSFGAASVPFGGSTTLTFTLTNPNSSNALTGVGFTDTLPAGLVTATPNGLTGSCGGGTFTATAGSNSITLAGATVAPGGSCTFAVNVTAGSVGAKTNTTSPVTSTNGGTGLRATASLTVTRAPTKTTVTAAPANPSLGSPVTFTATVVPSGPNGTGINPTGTVSFFLDGQATPVAVVPLSPSGTASFTTSGLGAGNHTLTASYSGDTNFLPSSLTTAAMVTVTCTTTITGGHTGTLVLGPGSTCIIGGTISGGIVVPKGSALDVEGATVTGSISADGATFFRLCGTTTNAVVVQNSTGFVLIGDPGDDGCAANTLHGSLTLLNNTGGLEVIGNHVAGSITIRGNSGAGPFPEDTAPEIGGNGP